VNPVIIGNATLHLGDCIGVMAGLPENSLDSIICDPPYLINFMGRAFDSQHKSLPGANEGQKMQEWHRQWVTEAYRILKPGGHLAAFGGDRTHHRLMSAMEDVGFELRFNCYWAFGCVDEETEVLTPSGWVRYHKSIDKIPLFCYNKDTDSFEWDVPNNEPRQVFAYDYEDTAYRITGDFTDQLVSRNHRCLVEREGKFVFQLAEEAAQESEIRIPVLETVQDLQKAYSSAQQNAGAKSEILQRLLACDSTEREGKEAVGGMQGACVSSLCCMREELLQIQIANKKNTKSLLQQEMQWNRKIEVDAGECNISEREVWMDCGISAVSERENEWREESSMEGRGDFAEQERKSWTTEHQVRSLPAAVYSDGENRRVCDGTQIDSCEGTQSSLVENGSCASCEPQCRGQSNRESDAVPNQHGSQEVRASRYAVTHLASIVPVHYKGLMWCPTVSTGAFVARRNGKIFITGNSGFPKSQNASIAIDQHFGMKDKREVVGLSNRHGGGINNNYMGMTKETSNAITKPYHPLAKQWSGYGTALKPAVEPICVGRKPMIGTLAENLLEWGCGAMNLDACRVETDDNLNGGAYCNGTKDLSNASSYATGINIGEFKQPIGRFPPHLLHDGSDVVKQCFPNAGSGNFGKEYCYSGREYNNMKTSMFNGDKPQSPSNYNDSGSASRFFPSLPYDEEDCAMLYYCAKASKEDRGHFNNHVSVKPTALMKWICRLLTPKGGTLLDPFMGSGSTLKAAVLENFTCIGIEMDADYFAIAEARVSHVSPDAVMVKATNPIKPTTKAVPVQAGLFEDAA
jgi:DNA modification methylase